jgi:GT2 family glycosyltransferase
MLLSVLVPTFRRPESLNLCLSGLFKQTRKADQIIVTVRTEDDLTVSVLEAWKSRLSIHKVQLSRPGVIAAMNQGNLAAIGDIVCLTDDDAIPRPDWLERIEAYFAADPKLGALGGRDVNHPQTKAEFVACEPIAGIVTNIGRIVGNHHLAIGEARYVDHLKGVNMSWRKAAARPVPFSEQFRGAGAQVHFELEFCWDMKQRGWKILFDPTLQIDHYPAIRLDDDNRTTGSLASRKNAAYNLYFALRTSLQPGMRKLAALLWARWIGTNGTPGTARRAVAVLRRDRAQIELGDVTKEAWTEARQSAQQQTRFSGQQSTFPAAALKAKDHD